MTGIDDRATGALLGLACGDALGRPVAGWTGAEIARRYDRLTELRAGGREGRPAGATTAVTGRTLDVGRALVRDDGDGVGANAGDVDRSPGSGGEGTDATGDAAGFLVRGVPAALAYRGAPDRCAAVVAGTSADDSDPLADPATAATVALARVVADLVDGADPDAALDAALADAARRDAPPAVRTALATATDGATASPGSGSGPVATLETALHDGLTAGTVEDAVVAAVNRGGGTTATGAAAGAVGGARFGADALPARWLDALDGAGELREVADALGGGATE